MMNFCAAAGAWGHERTEDRDVEREKIGKERLTGWLILARTWLGVCSQSLPPSGSTENLHHLLFFYLFFFLSFEEVQYSSVAQSCPLFVTPWTAAHQASTSITSS